MSEHPINELMESTMSRLKQMVDVNTIIGEAVEMPDGTVIIPVSRVGFGFAAGGSDFSSANQGSDKNFGGGSGAGVSISPVCFLVVGKDQIRLIPVTTNSTPVDKLVDYVPTLVDKVNNFVANRAKKDAE